MTTVSLTIEKNDQNYVSLITAQTIPTWKLIYISLIIMLAVQSISCYYIMYINIL